MKEKFSKLLTVKSLVTLLLSGVFCFMAVSDKITGTEFLTIFTVIISFYFGTQTEKNNENK